MKFKFVEPSVKMAKDIIHKMPYEKRLYIATIMWEGIVPETNELKQKLGNGFYNKLAGRNERKFKEALAMTVGKAWNLVEQQTIDYLDHKMSFEEKNVYKKKLLEVTYKQEPSKREFIERHFSTGEQNIFLFKQEILNDIQECKTKEYKAHLDYWVGEE